MDTPSMRLTTISLFALFTVATVSCSHSAGYYVDRGNARSKAGKYDDAWLEYRKAIQKDPRDGEAYYRAGLVAIQLRHGNDAYQALSTAEDMLPQRDDVKVTLGNVVLEGYLADPQRPKKLYDDLTRIAQELLSKNPNSFDGLRFKAAIAVTDGKLEEADELYRKANMVRPMQPELVLPWVQSLLKAKRYQDAEKIGYELIHAHKDVGQMYRLLYAGYTESNRPAEAESILKLQIANNPRDATAVLQLARHYERQQRTSDRDNTLKILLDNRDRFPQAEANVGDYYAAVRNWNEAYREYNQGLKNHPADKLLYERKISSVLISQGKREDALPVLEEILKGEPDDSGTKEMQAILLLDKGKSEQVDLAMKDLEPLVASHPQDPVLHFNLGRAYIEKGELDNAKAEFLTSARLDSRYAAPRLQLAAMANTRRNYSEILQYSNEILAVNPQDPNAKFWHLAGLIGTRSYGPARSELNLLLKQYPDSPDLLLSGARLDVAEKKFKDAETVYRKLYKPGQNDLRPLVGLASVYIAQMQYPAAIQLLNNELKQSPDSARLHYLMASVATQAQDMGLAIQQYQWLIAKNPKDLDPYIRASELYRLKGDTANATNYLQQARKLDPQNPVVVYMLANNANSAAEERQAVEDFRRQLAQKQDDPQALNNLAFVLADSDGNLDEALSLAQRAQQKLPNDPGVVDTLGWIYTKKNMNDSAIKILTNLVKKYPNAPDFRYHLGVALLQKGDTSEAKTELELALSEQPRGAVAERIKAAMQQADSTAKRTVSK